MRACGRLWQHTLIVQRACGTEGNVRLIWHVNIKGYDRSVCQLDVPQMRSCILIFDGGQMQYIMKNRDSRRIPTVTTLARHMPPLVGQSSLTAIRSC